MNNNRGFTLFAVMVALMAVVSSVFAVKLLAAASDRADRHTVTTVRLEHVRLALEAFLAANGYVPCPADGTEDSGLAKPTGATSVCTVPAGVVPWRTLGLATADAFDGWGRKISYRPYSGNGGMTQQADMSQCEAITASATAMLDVTSLTCPAPVPGPIPGGPAARAASAAYLAARPGLTVNDHGNMVSGIAYVLISHGITGNGAYLPGGARMALPSAANNSETSNTGSGGTYVIAEQSAASVDASAANHFDDQLLYRSMADAINLAGRGARPWTAACGC